MKFKIFISVLILGILGVIIVTSDKQPTPSKGTVASSSSITSDRQFHDFGEISMKDGKVRYQATIKNSKDSPVKLAKLHTSCMCTTVAMDVGEQKLGPFGMEGHGGTVPDIDLALDPAQEAKLEVEFDPAAHGPSGVGVIERSVYVDMAGGARTKLQFKATVRP